jgi:hypothetical protein
MALRSCLRFDAGMRRTPPLRVDFEPSRLRAAWIAVSHGATAALVAWLPLSTTLRSFALLLVLGLALRALRAGVPAGLVLREDGSLVILGRGGTRRARACLVLPDMLPAAEFRRLRVRLRYAINADAAGAPDSQAWASSSAALSPFG